MRRRSFVSCLREVVAMAREMSREVGYGEEEADEDGEGTGLYLGVRSQVEETIDRVELWVQNLKKVGKHMGLRTLRGVDGDDANGRAVLYCSTSERALPWIFESGEEADAFVGRYGDVRKLKHWEQEELYNAFVTPEARAVRRAKEDREIERWRKKCVKRFAGVRR